MDLALNMLAPSTQRHKMRFELIDSQPLRFLPNRFVCCHFLSKTDQFFIQYRMFFPVCVNTGIYYHFRNVYQLMILNNRGQVPNDKYQRVVFSSLLPASQHSGSQCVGHDPFGGCISNILHTDIQITTAAKLQA